MGEHQPADRKSPGRHRDEVCDRFEQAWREGQKPRIEEYLGTVEVPERAELLRELLAVEIELRLARGDRPALQNYRDQFPEYLSLVDSAYYAAVPSAPGAAGRVSDLSPGAEPIAGYRLVELLGRGGSGEVWKAIGPGGFGLALKFVRLDEPLSRAELRALEDIKDIHHPHLLAMFGSWQVGDYLVIAMQLAERTLMQVYRDAVGRGLPGIPAPEIFQYFQDAAQGIDYLNEPRHPAGQREVLGIQHRDIKPQNLLLVGGRVQVADFGLARVLEKSQLSQSNAMTPAYAAPEFYYRRVSGHSDQYSLAVTYCHMRGGRLPFTGSLVELLKGHTEEPPDLMMLPPGEEPAVARALAKNPNDRWPSCRAFLEGVLAGDHAFAPLGSRPRVAATERPTLMETPTDQKVGLRTPPISVTDDAPPNLDDLTSQRKETLGSPARPSESSEPVRSRPQTFRARAIKASIFLLKTIMYIGIVYYFLLVFAFFFEGESLPWWPLTTVAVLVAVAPALAPYVHRLRERVRPSSREKSTRPSDHPRPSRLRVLASWVFGLVGAGALAVTIFSAPLRLERAVGLSEYEQSLFDYNRARATDVQRTGVMHEYLERGFERLRPVVQRGSDDADTRAKYMELMSKIQDYQSFVYDLDHDNESSSRLREESRSIARDAERLLSRGGR